MTNLLPSSTFTPGAILVDSWGWDQTNIDFFRITKRSGDFVTVEKLKKSTSPEIGFMQNDEMPLDEVDPSFKPMRKKIKTWNGVERGFSFRNYTGGGWCSLWKGNKVRSTHYA